MDYQFSTVNCFFLLKFYFWNFSSLESINLHFCVHYILYFIVQFGSLLSIYGCYQYGKLGTGTDSEQGFYMPLLYNDGMNKSRMRKTLDSPQEKFLLRTESIWSYLFQVIFQVDSVPGITGIFTISQGCLNTFPLINQLHLRFLSMFLRRETTVVCNVVF